MVKKLVTMILVVAFVSLIAINAAEARSRYRHSWGGAGIVLGAFALGIITNEALSHRQPEVIYAPPPPPPYYPPRAEYIPGHWELTREWVPGTWERVWVPEYYDRNGRLMGGHYEDRQTPGYYEERRVWVEGYYRR